MYYVFNQNQEAYLTSVQASLQQSDFFPTTTHQKLVASIPTTVQIRTYEWRPESSQLIYLPTFRPVFVVETELSLENYEYSSLDSQVVHTYLATPD